jgi:putative restriction endonuclease
MFAGFDIQRHRTFTAGSPSVQIDIHTIHEALNTGLAFSVKENDEIAIGVRPDQFIDYVMNAESLHSYGADAETLGLVRQAVASVEISERETVALPLDRQRIISNVSRYSRDANFRRKVLSAYDKRCAVTRCQLKLVDAAHILPVAMEGSSDHVSNGVALSPTMHRAFDNGLIYLDEQFRIQLNGEKVDRLEASREHGGIDTFSMLMNRRIHLPADNLQWPDVDFIIQANKSRRIPGY